jgi:hypothetical protein
MKITAFSRSGIIYDNHLLWQNRKKKKKVKKALFLRLPVSDVLLRRLYNTKQRYERQYGHE